MMNPCSFSASRRHNLACCAGLESTNLSCRKCYKRSCCHERYTGTLLEVDEVCLEDSNRRFLFASPAQSSTATCIRHLYPLPEQVSKSLGTGSSGWLRLRSVIHVARFLIAHSLVFFVLAGTTPFTRYTLR